MTAFLICLSLTGCSQWTPKADADSQTAPGAAPAPQPTPTPTAPGQGAPATPANPPAQTPPPAVTQPRPAPPIPTATNPPANTDYLGEKMALGDGRTMWPPTRRQIGMAYGPGSSAATPPTMLSFTVDPQKLAAYLAKLAPYVRRAPVNARPVVLSKYGKNAIEDRSDSKPASIK
ncbi:MAG TPA: hypothetical protein VFW40_12200, partial [Capsulimonadaceae bacterium]|nr:hypothetical protein [Capsulimonadaceae bacterium]